MRSHGEAVSSPHPGTVPLRSAPLPPSERGGSGLRTAASSPSFPPIPGAGPARGQSASPGAEVALTVAVAVPGAVPLRPAEALPKWEGRAEHMGAAFGSGGIPGAPSSSAHGKELRTAGVGTCARLVSRIAWVTSHFSYVL